MRKAWIPFALALFLPAGGAAPQDGETPQLWFTFSDGRSVQGRMATPSITLETELGTFTASTLQFRGGQKHGEVWRLNIGDDLLVGRLTTGTFNLKSPTGLVEIPTATLASIHMMAGAIPDRAAWPPPATFKPLATLLEKCSISQLQLSRDGKHLYFLEATRDGHKLRALDTERRQFIGAGMKVPQGLNAFRISPDGKSLILFPETIQPRIGDSSRIVILNAPDLTQRSDFTIEYVIADLQPHPKGGQLFVSGWGPKLESMAVVDPEVPGLVAIWNPGLQASTFRIFSDGRRAIASPVMDNQCAELSIPDNPAKSAPTLWTFTRPRGERGFVLTLDEKFIVWQSGTVCRAGPLGDRFPVVAQTARHVTALAAPDGVLLMPMKDGTASRFAAPEFKPLRPIPVGYPWYAAVIDPDRRLVYAATDRREQILVGAGQPGGDLCVFDLAPLVAADDPESSKKVVALSPHGDLKPLKSHPIGASIRSIAVHGTPARFLFLDGTENVVRSYEAATGEARGVSRRFPHPTRCLVVDGDRHTVHILGAGAPDEPGAGRWYQVDPTTLAVRSETPLDFVPRNADVDPQGRLFITREAGTRSELWILDPARQSAIARWSLESERPQVRISRGSRTLFLGAPFQGAVLPAELPANPRLIRGPAHLSGVTGEPFQIDAAGRSILFDSGVVLTAAAGSPMDVKYAGVLPPFRAAAILEGAKLRLALSDLEGRMRIVSMPDLAVLKEYRTDHVLSALAFDPASGVLAGASEGPPLTGPARHEPRVGPAVFFKVPE